MQLAEDLGRIVLRYDQEEQEKFVFQVGERGKILGPDT
jgi:hypothetical protein